MKKVPFAGVVGLENGFSPAYLLSLLRLVKGIAKLNTLLEKSVINMI
jgi:hypothetical protein